jgi:hypothetical protein
MSATASVNQAEVNRANSQHSTGPKTDEGKQISSLNALRHGLTAQVALLPNEDRLAYQRHLKSFQDHLQPQGPVEANLVQSLADTAWRLNRVVRLETKLLRSPDSLETQIKSLANLSLYTQRLTRQFEKVEKQLRELQDLRRNRQKPIDNPKPPQPMASFFQTPNSTPPDARRVAPDASVRAAAPAGPLPLAPDASGE